MGFGSQLPTQEPNKHPHHRGCLNSFVALHQQVRDSCKLLIMVIPLQAWKKTIDRTRWNCWPVGCHQLEKCSMQNIHEKSLKLSTTNLSGLPDVGSRKGIRGCPKPISMRLEPHAVVSCRPLFSLVTSGLEDITFPKPQKCFFWWCFHVESFI